MSSSFRVCQASIRGSEHLRLRQNNQDGVCSRVETIDRKVYAVGVVADGCSDGAHSEVGANLLARFVVQETMLLIRSGVPLDQIPPMLFIRCIAFLRTIIFSYGLDSQEMAQFVKDYLLCTVVGFVADDTGGLLFTNGDGAFLVDSTPTVIDMGNRAPYLAYHLVHRKFLAEQAGEIPSTFMVTTLPPETQRIAVFTDGAETPTQDAIAPDLLAGMWAPDSSNGLRFLLNRLDLAKKLFTDDCSLVTCERIAIP